MSARERSMTIILSNSRNQLVINYPPFSLQGPADIFAYNVNDVESLVCTLAAASIANAETDKFEEFEMTVDSVMNE